MSDSRIFSKGETVVLGNTRYLVVRMSPLSVELEGPRGGVSFLLPHPSDTTTWMHVPDTPRKVRPTWYQRREGLMLQIDAV